MSDSEFDSKAFLAHAPTAPGIYQMFDAEGNLLYVGKAKVLKKRLSSYFRKSGLPIKTQAMMARVTDIQVTVTHTENEALILESNLIKDLKPHYNILLRDSKSYPFIHIDDSHEFPRLAFYRGDRSKPGKYFGPYPGVTAIRETLALLQKVLPVRQCDDVFYSNRTRPCLQHQIKRCSAPCVGLVSKENYAKDIELAGLFLQGKDESLVKVLEKNMSASAKALDYEAAAAWRDRINALRTVQQHQAITSGMSDIDLLTIASNHGKVCVEVSFVRGGRHSGSNGHFPHVPLEFSEAEVLSAFITQYYNRRAAPKQIITGVKLPDKKELAEWLSDQAGHKVVISDQVRGTRADWLSMAQINVNERLKSHLSKAEGVLGRFKAFADVFGLKDPINRIECFDISHTFGKQTVAACVVFTQEGAVKSEYRRYNIAGITPGDDYAAMEQAITRRYKRVIKEQGKLPDILLIDGGKGQLNAALKIVESLGVDSMLLVGVAKGEGRKAGLETLFIKNHKLGIQLAANSPEMHLVNQIRDEAHRFAITGHRARRAKSQTRSVLEDIPGIGAKRRGALLRYFGGLQGVQAAGKKDLQRVEGINDELADAIYGYFHH